MFTGIIEEVGRIRAVRGRERAMELTVSARKVLEDLKLGDSVAVNGICLTVTRITADTFTADVMRETLSRTSLARLREGSPVNLERAMPADGRFGGHIVTGHIDGTGTILRTERDSNSIRFTIGAPPEILCLIVEKGSVAIDGISLTVAEVSRESFSVCVIPHTLANTVLYGKTAGAPVNLENDCVGKYIRKLLSEGGFVSASAPAAGAPGSGAPTAGAPGSGIPIASALAAGVPVAGAPAAGTAAPGKQGSSVLTREFLARHGYGNPE